MFAKLDNVYDQSMGDYTGSCLCSQYECIGYRHLQAQDQYGNGRADTLLHVLRRVRGRAMLRRPEGHGTGAGQLDAPGAG